MPSAEKYMKIALTIAELSKDSSTRVGALIVGARGEIRASGWNGAARGCSADEDNRCSTRPEKYMWMVHAEANAIANAAAVGTPLEGTSIFVTHPPCMACANLIVQAGIKEVITYQQTTEFETRWKEHTVRTEKLFEECGVSYTTLENWA